jgi:hypothetical protein
MAYTPINWAENSGVTAVKLDQMDGQIDTNESDITNIINGSTINTLLENAVYGSKQTYSVPGESTINFPGGPGLYYIDSNTYLQIDGNTFNSSGLKIVDKNNRFTIRNDTVDTKGLVYWKITFSN